MTIFDDVSNDSRLYKEMGSLRDLGYDVEILCVKYTKLKLKAKYNDAPKHRIYVGQQATGKMRFLRFFLKGPLRALRIKADLYHVHDLYTLPVAYLAAKLRGKPVIYDSREFFLGIASLSTRPFERAAWRLVERCLISHVDRSITVGDAIADALCAYYRIPRPLVVGNCPTKQVPPKGDLFRKMYGIDPDSKILLYLGGLQQGRGLFRIIESLPYLSGCVFIALGDGPLLEELTEYARSLHVHSRTFFVEAVPVEWIIEYAASADLGLCIIENAGLSYVHSLPNKLFEYIMAGLPVVASDFPEMGRIVKREEIGLLVDPDDPEDIASAIKKMFENADFYNTCQVHCSMASMKYNWEMESQPLVDMYRQLASYADRV